MNPYRTPGAIPPAPQRPSWWHRLAHLLHLHGCTCDVAYDEDSGRLLVRVICATCGAVTVLAPERVWVGTYVDRLLERRHIPKALPGDFLLGAIESTVRDLDTKHAAVAAELKRLNEMLRHRIDAARDR